MLPDALSRATPSIASDRTRVLSIQTPILGHRTYGALLRDVFRDSPVLDFDAHWSTEAHDEHGDGLLERQLDRLFLKMVERSSVRSRNLDFFPLRYEVGTSYWASRSLRSLLRTRRPDVLHFHTQAVALLSLDIMARIPTVITADGTASLMAQMQVGSAWRWTYAGNVRLEGLAFRRSAAVVAFSRWAANAVRERHGIDRDRIHVIPPGLDLSRFCVTDRAARADGKRRILFIGGDFERKGGPELVAAFLSLYAQGSDIELHVVTRDASSVIENPRIFVHTDVEAYSERWHELYRMADVFVMPTKREQFGLVYLEAMAMGLPVVAASVGAAAEIVRDGESGFVVTPGDVRMLADRVSTLLGDRELRAAFGRNGRARIEREFEAQKNGAALASVFAAASRSRASKPTP